MRSNKFKLKKFYFHWTPWIYLDPLDLLPDPLGGLPNFRRLISSVLKEANQQTTQLQLIALFEKLNGPPVGNLFNNERIILNSPKGALCVCVWYHTGRQRGETVNDTTRPLINEAVGRVIGISCVDEVSTRRLTRVWLKFVLWKFQNSFFKFIHYIYNFFKFCFEISKFSNLFLLFSFVYCILIQS